MTGTLPELLVYATNVLIIKTLLDKHWQSYRFYTVYLSLGL